jgi:hypothetical protein
MKTATPKLIRFKGALYRLASKPTKSALVLMHLDSIDNAATFGLDQADVMQADLSREAASFPGHCIAVTQAWDSYRANAIIQAGVGNPHGHTVIEFDEATQEWDDFFVELKARLDELQVGRVTVGGFWWDDVGGCARGVYDFLKSRGYRVGKSKALYNFDTVEGDYYTRIGQ